jgi:transposase
MQYQASPRTIPAETVRVARRAFPKGNNYMRMRDELGSLYEDSRFAALFVHEGRAAESPGNLAQVLVMQYAEGLSDRQVAEAVRARIDWKYALALPLEDEGFVHGRLGQFRERLVAGGAEMLLLEAILERLGDLGLLKGKSKQRTDSTHVLAATRELNRLELVGETMRLALEVLAVAYPGWLRVQVTADWFERYGARFEEYRLPRNKAERYQLAETMGQDGFYLWQQLSSATAPAGSQQLPAVEILRQVWLQQYWLDGGQVRWRRPADGLPPSALMIQSPLDIEARYSRKREEEWVGYKVHLTESCDPDSPNFITHVHTTLATTPDSAALPTIQQALIDKGLPPDTHLVDAGYVEAGNLATSADQQIDLYGPAPADTSWQGRTPDVYDLSTFAIDWQAHQVTCPNGALSRTWSPSRNTFGRSVIHVQFAPSDCQPCPWRMQCTQATTARSLKLLPQAEHNALQHARQRQQLPSFWLAYRQRAGIEGTISQAVRSFDLRRSPFIGLLKTHLHNVLIASAINLSRAVAHWRRVPKARTRSSPFLALAVS